MNEVEEVDHLLEEIKGLSHDVDAMLRTELDITGRRWIEFLETEEFWNWGERFPALIEPLHDILKKEKKWYVRRTAMCLGVTRTDVVVLMGWRSKEDALIADLLAEHGLGADEVFEAKEWRDQLHARDLHRFMMTADFSAAHDARLEWVADALDYRSFGNALRVAHIAKNELAYFFKQTAPLLCQPSPG